LAGLRIAGSEQCIDEEFKPAARAAAERRLDAGIGAAAGVVIGRG